MGVASVPARAAALEAARGATDFGEYFTYFSFFLVVSALLLAVLFFKLGIEQRLRQIGILRAAGLRHAGHPPAAARRSGRPGDVGALLGVAGAIVYGRVIVYGLRHVVGRRRRARRCSSCTSRRSRSSLGALGGIVAADRLRLRLAARRRAAVAPRAADSAVARCAAGPAMSARQAKPHARASSFGVLGLGLLGVGFSTPSAQAGAFFGAGAALLVASLLCLSAWLRAATRDRSPAAAHGRSHGSASGAPHSGRHEACCRRR